MKRPVLYKQLEQKPEFKQSDIPVKENLQKNVKLDPMDPSTFRKKVLIPEAEEIKKEEPRESEQVQQVAAKIKFMPAALRRQPQV